MPRPARPWYRQQTGWWMAWVNRRQVKLLQGKDTKQDLRRAEQALKEVLQVHQACPTPEAGRHTVAGIIDLYLAHARQKYKPSTLAERLHYLQGFAEAHGWRPVNDRDCLPYHLESWIDSYKGITSAWTRAHVAAVVQRPFNWAVKRRLITANPFRGVTYSTGAPRRPITDEEFTRLLRATSAGTRRRRNHNPKPSSARRSQHLSPGARFRQVLVFLRFTGARPGELCHLEWRDVDLEREQIVLREHKTTNLQRQPKPRIIPLHPVVVKLLSYLRRREEHDRLVFLTHRRSGWNKSNLGLRMRRAREAAGIDASAKLYGLRHGFGTRSIMNGVDLKTVSELMGHTSVRMTEHYLHLAGQQQHLAAAMRRANGPGPAR